MSLAKSAAAAAVVLGGGALAYYVYSRMSAVEKSNSAAVEVASTTTGSTATAPVGVCTLSSPQSNGAVCVLFLNLSSVISRDEPFPARV